MKVPAPVIGMIGPVLMGLGVVAFVPHDEHPAPTPAKKPPAITAVETYTSSQPGRSIRLTRVDADTVHVEHVDLETGRIIWSGELTIVAGP